MKVGGIDLAVRESGEGIPFLWGHGLLGSVAQEDDVDLLSWPELAQAVRLIRYDARGHGGSAAGRSDAANRWDQLGADLLELAGALGIERFVAAGASMGVAASLHAALLAPTRIAALLLLIPPTAWESRPAQAGLYSGMAQLLEEKGNDALAELVEAELRKQPVTPGFEPAQEALLEALRVWDPPALGHVLRGAAESDLPDRERLEEIDAPALIVAVREDPGHPLSTAEELALDPPVLTPVPATVLGVADPSASLCGTWRFSPAPPEGFEKAAFNDGEWAAIEVPGEWAVQGFTVAPGTAAAYQNVCRRSRLNSSGAMRGCSPGRSILIGLPHVAPPSRDRRTAVYASGRSKADV